ncbi:MAG: hypothetical protein HY313_03350 [Acidobacteria bacterium]|nr:hypothetical protein [Acidobacteriota bacterium]
MAFRVRYRGLEVICETLQDVDALADRLEKRSESATKPTIQRFPRLPLENRQHGSARLLMGEIGKRQRAFLEELVKHGSLTDNDARQLLSLRDNKALAGILTGISRRSGASGIVGKIVKKYGTRNGTGERHYTYSIVPEFIEEVKAGLGIKG